VLLGQEHKGLLLVDLNSEVLIEEADDHPPDLREAELSHQGKAWIRFGGASFALEDVEILRGEQDVADPVELVRG
jgi:hypothetical protein